MEINERKENGEREGEGRRKGRGGEREGKNGKRSPERKNLKRRNIVHKRRKQGNKFLKQQQMNQQRQFKVGNICIQAKALL